MSLLSDPLLPTLAQNPSHLFSYHHPLPPTSSATLTAIIHPGTPTHRKTNQAKNCLIGFSLLIFLFDWLLFSYLSPLNNPEHQTLLHRATGNRCSPDLSLVPARIASKCTWQTLPDLGSDHLPISITIPTSPLINSIHRLPPHLTTIKLSGTITLLILIPTALLTLTLQHFLFLKPPTPLPNSSMMLPLLPFLSAASIALLKPGGLPKSQMPSQNAERHLQRHTAQKKTASTISPLPDIPPL